MIVFFTIRFFGLHFCLFALNFMSFSTFEQLYNALFFNAENFSCVNFFVSHPKKQNANWNSKITVKFFNLKQK